MIKFVILFLLCILPIMSFAQSFSRHELLEQGRSSLNVLNEYERIKNKEVDHLYVDLFFKSFEPYYVDTSAGRDKSILFFGGLDVMVNVGNTSRFVFISELFWMSSKNREYIDGDGDRKNVRYGLATDVYVGVDQRLFNFVVLQLGGVIGHTSLYDSNVDTSRPGENLYTMTGVENKWRFYPTFGAYLYGFTLINFGTTITYSIDKKNITNSQTVIDIRFSYFIDNMGDLRIGYKTYSFMDNEESMIIEWHNLYKMINIGAEIFTKDVSRLGNIFIEVQLDLFKIFKKTSEQTRKLRDSTAGNSTASPLNSDTRPNTASAANPEHSEKRKTPRHMKAVDKATKLLLITKFNVARTRETAQILASDKFVFGVKAGLSFSFNERFIVEGFYLRNVFEEILQFRHAVNRHGFLVRMVFHI